MADVNERIEILEKNLNDLSLDLHASKVAINVLSTVINTLSGEPGLLERSYEQTRSSAPLVKFNHPVEEGYEDKLTERILNLLSTTQHELK
ncbi:TPA: hypothetical protein ACNVAS_000614 [Citrobacter amalonaticus]|uniref:hypothetical protein n=2 Tax=Enterobacteriaceae TaxID=543 RepID=UPI0007333F29|nr:hypothetical protein [Citrobacter amalonaticus]EKW3842729.1 hypothetical protein [Citrobacter amalonaticus]EKX8495727.1 hypothetical protein [Citrobacter amalonaticus]ELO0858376.1 hypothetical protein [Citrobacter amalonaticus]MDV0784843.1 hypothetical protein [Citrobacter amalonaticus]MEB0640906.1 hypothetical protein [Citrobacter amalonaticus]